MLCLLRLVCCLVATLAVPIGARAAASPWVGDAHAAARLIAATRAVGSGASVDAAIEFRLAPGWHVYWRSPGDAGLPPGFDWSGSGNLAAASVAWPAPTRLVASGLQTAIYRGQLALPVSVTLARPAQALQLRLGLDYAACAAVCVPYRAALALDLPPGVAVPDAAEATRIADAIARVPGTLEAAGLRLDSAAVAPRAAGGSVLALRIASLSGPLRAPDLLVEGLGQVTPAAPSVDLSPDGRRARLLVALPSLRSADVAGKVLSLTLVDAGRSAVFAVVPRAGALPARYGAGWVGILAVALLGGLVLNAMPCVLPVLSLKLLAVAAHQPAGRRQVRTGLLATAAGVLLSFLVLAGALAGLRAAGEAVGWGIQFQQPWFLAGMALLTALFAASLWDRLPIGLPGLSLAATIGSRRPWLDALLTGVVATLLATPCSAPFVGTAVGFALSRGAAEIVAVFAALGLGMAAPYLLAAAVPGAISLLPRPGAWMLWLRRGMGGLLAATSLWLLAVLATLAGPEAAALAGGALAVCLAVLVWRPAGRGQGWAAACLAAVTVLGPGLVPAPAPTQQAPGPGWQRFDAGSIARLIADGRVVLVDVTADWCLTCKANALAVLDRDPVAGRLRAPMVVAMRADWTRPNPAITRYLQSFGRYGVPMDVVYGPAEKAGIALPELLTSARVIDAMRRAAAPTRTVAAR